MNNFPLLPRPHPSPSPSSSTPISFAQHRLRGQPTPSLPNLRATPLSVSLSSSARVHQADRPPDRMSNDTSTLAPSSPIATHPYSALELQKHLYASFLEGKTADVSLRIHGSWRATYRLHRVVLIQAVSYHPRPVYHCQLCNPSAQHIVML